MSGTLSINFGDIVNELESRDLAIVHIPRLSGMYVEDVNGDLYQIESYYHPGYLDDLITNGRVINFEYMDNEAIRGYAKEYRGPEYVQDFIEKMEL